MRHDELTADKLHEECGLFAILTDKISGAPAADTYHALYALQHRGQTSAGIAVSDGTDIHYKKGDGLVPDVFTPAYLETLRGSMALGHVRYATHGGTSGLNAHPIVVESRGEKLALAFNGNLTNAAQLRSETEAQGGIFQTTGDAEILLYVIVRELLTADSLETAVQRATRSLQGAYSLVLMTRDRLIALRDPCGFKPLCVGQSGDTLAFASESCALESVGLEFLRDVRPGEMLVAGRDGLRSYSCGTAAAQALCVFEFVYFARPDSVIDGVSVELARQMAGRCLARQERVEADVVIGVPDSGLSAALGYAQEAGLPYSVGFVKNRYIGRTFIQATQSERKNALRIKLNALASVVRGKRVVMVDDSIVRGTTCGRIVTILREAGALEVHMRVSSPPYRYPCYFGTDIPSSESLIAHNHSLEEIPEMIGVDSLGYLRLEDFKDILSELQVGYCEACFTGRYPIPVAPESKTSAVRSAGKPDAKEIVG